MGGSESQRGLNRFEISSNQRSRNLLLLLQTRRLAGELQKNSARFQTGDGALCFNWIGIESLHSPEPALQTKVRMTAGADCRGGLLIVQHRGDAIHASLASGKLAIVRDG